MSEKTVKDIAEIEEAQALLRESIEATKELAQRAENLLQKHKARVEQEVTDPSASPAPPTAT